MPPAPASPGDTPRFDPRSEQFLESLRNLLEFEVVRQHFDENRIEIHHVYSRSMIDALEHATAQLEGGGWYVESITRIWDEQFFANLPGNQSPEAFDDPDGFISMMTRLFTESEADTPLEE